jgi:hypothetical protein
MTTWPTWAIYLLGFGSPVLAFVGGALAPLVTRKGDTELEARSKREEVMRNLRWAAELAVSDVENTSRLGVAELRALAASPLLDAEEQGFIDAALLTVIKDAAAEVEALEIETGEEPEIVQLVEDLASLADGPPAALSSDEDDRDGGA